MPFIDYYALLGVSSDATTSEVEAAWRALARQLHPDRNPDDPEAERRMALVNAAREELCNPASRAAFHAEWFVRRRQRDGPADRVFSRSPNGRIRGLHPTTRRGTPARGVRVRRRRDDE